MGDYDVLPRDKQDGDLSSYGRDESVASLVGGRDENCFLLFASGRSRDLCCRCFRRERPPFDNRQGAGCFAGMESQDEWADCVRERPDWFTADLHDGVRWHQPAAYD